MKKSSILFLITLLIASYSFAQQMEKSKADSLRDEGQLDKAIEVYAELFKENPDNRTNTYNYACALALNHQIDTAFHYLQIATAKDTSVQALNDPDFYYLTKDKRWSAIENTLVERVEAKFGKYEDLALSKELWKMKITDQAFYYHLDIADKLTERNGVVTSAIWETKELLNQKNVARIEEIIAEKGWPKKSIIKGSAASTVFLVIQHADKDIQEKYLPLMREAADAGEANWSSLALLIDRINLGQGKEQIYGSQIHRAEDGVFFVPDLQAPEYVNQRRAEVGLGPIEEYVKHWGMEWTVPQKEK